MLHYQHIQITVFHPQYQGLNNTLRFEIWNQYQVKTLIEPLKTPYIVTVSTTVTKIVTKTNQVN